MDSPLGTLPGFDFERFYLSHRRAVLKAAFGLLSDWQKAEDVTQEAFLILHQKTSSGTLVASPRAYVQTWAYFLCRRQFRRETPETALEDPRRLHSLLEKRPDCTWLCSASSLDLISAFRAVEQAWNGFGFWGRRMISVALRHVLRRQRLRLYVLMSSESRPVALLRLRQLGDAWTKSSVCMTLSRYSSKVDKYLERSLRDGPCCPEEHAHWSVFRHFCQLRSDMSVRFNSTQSTLGWMIRGLQRLDASDREAMVSLFFEPDLPNVPLALVKPQPLGACADPGQQVELCQACGGDRF